MEPQRLKPPYPGSHAADIFLSIFMDLRWWSQAESNRRPLQCHCHGLPFLTISDSLHCELNPLKISVFESNLFSGRFQKLLFCGDLVAI
jgi:hypothetical protein